ncbi:hypothetical protein Lpla01_00877 [Lactiplantibacillus plajomi]
MLTTLVAWQKVLFAVTAVPEQCLAVVIKMELSWYGLALKFVTNRLAPVQSGIANAVVLPVFKEVMNVAWGALSVELISISGLIGKLIHWFLFHSAYLLKWVFAYA